MKHINLSSWRGSITDWTELNYIKGGLDDYYADIANVSGNILRYSKNIWDEQWEAGAINTSTGAVEEGSRVIPNNYINVFPDTTYYFKIGSYYAHIFYYNSNKSFISYESKSNATFTTPEDCCYIKFMTAGSYGSVYNNDIMISEGSATPIDYEPYGSLVIEDNSTDPATIIIVP